MIDGADPDAVRRALSKEDPLSGTGGFAGELDDALVRDALGRYPVFFERQAGAPAASDAWSFDPTALTDPVSVPAGHRVDATGSEQVLSLPDPSPCSSDAAAVAAVRDAVAASVDAVSTDGLAIAFSGGLDSAMLAARLDVPLYVAGFPDSHDVEAARSAADLLDADLTVIELTHDDLVDAVPRIARATGRTNAMDVQIALGLFLAADRAASDGFERLAVGQGADELFGGYAKVAKAPEDPASTPTPCAARVGKSYWDSPDSLNATSSRYEPLAWNRSRRCSTIQWSRRHSNFPGTSSSPMTEPGKWPSGGPRANGSPDEIAQRDKKAVQYGSLVSRELDRLARQAGFKRRMDDHVGKYVASLL